MSDLEDPNPDYEPPPHLQPPRSYTLKEITRLAAEWIAEQEGDTEMLKWTFSIFVGWVKQRERESK